MAATAALCDFDYRVSAAPSQQPCLTAMMPWSNPLVRLTQYADGGITLSIDGGTLRGTWDRDGGFTATGMTRLMINNIPLDLTNTITARFSTCDRWAGRWQQQGSLCALDWDAGAIRQ